MDIAVIYFTLRVSRGYNWLKIDGFLLFIIFYYKYFFLLREVLKKFYAAPLSFIDWKSCLDGNLQRHFSIFSKLFLSVRKNFRQPSIIFEEMLLLSGFNSVPLRTVFRMR